MHAITTPPHASWSAQFLYVLARFGLGLDGLVIDNDEALDDISQR